MAPMARTWAFVQTRSENNGVKGARRAIISGGRSTGVSPGSVACVPPSILVNDPRDLLANLAKVELESSSEFLARLHRSLPSRPRIEPGNLATVSRRNVTRLAWLPPVGQETEKLPY